ncbi:divalent metal cation transporter, partial [Sulfolobus sp. F3]
LIRGKFSTSLALLSSMPMFGVDVFTYVVEYSGIAVGSLILGIPIYISLPSFFLIHLAIILTKKYTKAEKILLGISFILMISFIIQAGLRGIVPNQQIFYFSSSPSFIFLVAANIGAVIMPFMLFYQASATAYKYIDANSSSEVKVRWSSYETIIGAIVSEALMVAIELATTGISKSVDPLNYEQVSQALSIISGNLSPYIFGIGL